MVYYKDLKIRLKSLKNPFFIYRLFILSVLYLLYRAYAQGFVHGYNYFEKELYLIELFIYLYLPFLYLTNKKYNINILTILLELLWLVINILLVLLFSIGYFRLNSFSIIVWIVALCILTFIIKKFKIAKSLNFYTVLVPNILALIATLTGDYIDHRIVMFLIPTVFLYFASKYISKLIANESEDMLLLQ